MIWRMLAALRRLAWELSTAQEPDLCDRWRKVRAITNDDIRAERTRA